MRGDCNILRRGRVIRGQSSTPVNTGDFLELGSTVAVALQDLESEQAGEFMVSGMIVCRKTPGFKPAKGDPLFFDRRARRVAVLADETAFVRIGTAAGHSGMCDTEITVALNGDDAVEEPKPEPPAESVEEPASPPPPLPQLVTDEEA